MSVEDGPSPQNEPDDDPQPAGARGEDPASAAQTEGAPEAEEPAEPEAEAEEEILFADLALPSLDEIRSALDWAFEKEDAPAEYLDRCAEHAVIVQAANRRMNLTKIVEPKDIAAKHYLDCWRTTRLLPLLGRTVLDIGTGAGYPGIPVALSEPNAHVVLVDSTTKKAEFVGETIEKMVIPNAEALAIRAEEYLLRNKVDVALVRALSSVRENVRLLRKVRHSLHDLIMMKGPSWSREVRAGEREAERLGFRLDTVWEHELPGELGGRAVLVYRAPGSQGM
ncbi:MAG: 16S rRNA (guanine(527)-N(7))-methyltransferase RsmG [Planctomycetes bacterium]|jgi:16S rRNA (guanine527-N7)-methyltransferase|nr:16S rRNA (guanine(527)-N(7))-methyltransferase RsmG [Planctomycetota bacterium]